jgi:hypothetical protein
MDLSELITMRTDEMKPVEAGSNGPHDMNTVIRIWDLHEQETGG